MALFPGYFANVYGSTEALTVACCDYRRHADKLGSVGKASIGMEARVIRTDSRDPDDLCKAGEIGQLITQRAQPMTEYFGLSERTAAAFSNDWFSAGRRRSAQQRGLHHRHGPHGPHH